MDDRTKEILRRFEESWQHTQEYFDDLINNYDGFQRLKPLRQFISKLKEKGADQFFRAGTSMHTLLLSRSVNSGLRLDQKYVKIDAIDPDDYEITMCDGEKTYRQFRINDLEDYRLMKLLETLKHTLVD